MKAFDPRAKIPDALIDAFVDRIIYDKGVFSWYLSPKIGKQVHYVRTQRRIFAIEGNVIPLKRRIR